ncbi:hypothetical protein AB192_02015 [Aliivibrio fischeri]|nr:hypothetical protein AB192_02015 [Aliivibrio fischeri]
MESFVHDWSYVDNKNRIKLFKHLRVLNITCDELNFNILKCILHEFEILMKSEYVTHYDFHVFLNQQFNIRRFY